MTLGTTLVNGVLSKVAHGLSGAAARSSTFFAMFPANFSVFPEKNEYCFFSGLRARGAAFSPIPCLVYYTNWCSPYHPRFSCFCKGITCQKYNGNCWVLAAVGWLCKSASKPPVVNERSNWARNREHHASYGSSPLRAIELQLCGSSSLHSSMNK